MVTDGCYCCTANYGKIAVEEPPRLSSTKPNAVEIEIWVTNSPRSGPHIDLPVRDSEIALRSLADRIGATLDDACTTMRFPRPRVLLSLDSTPVERGRGLSPTFRSP